MEVLQADEEGAESVPTANTLPSCLICGGPGHGLHYGVNSCDACKGFFHRSMRIHSVYKCAKDATCNVRYGKGKMCKLCRYHKCLQVGMSEKAIKLGRHSTKRRYESLVELERAHNANLSSPLTSQQTEIDVKLLTNDQPDKKDIVKRLDPPDLPVIAGDASKASSMPSLQRNDTRPQHRYPSPVSEEEYPLGPKTLIIEKSANYFAPTENLPLDHIDSGRTLLAMTPPQSSWPEGDVPRGDCNRILPPLSDRARTLELYANTDIILQTLMESEQTYIGSFDEKCRLEILKQAEEHFEECKLRTEMFRKLHVVNESEHDRPYSATGLHTGEGLNFLADIVEASEMNVRKMVRFMKIVPAFSLFTMKDKINLLKHGCAGFTFLSMCEHVHLELGTVPVAPGVFFCPYDAIRYSHVSDINNAFASLIKFSKVVQALNVTDEERLILRTLTVITPDCSGLDNAPLVHEVHRRLCEIMIGILAKRYKNPEISFATIINIMTDVRSFNMDFDIWMAKLNNSKYVTEQSPLLKEMLDAKTADYSKSSPKDST